MIVTKVIPQPLQEAPRISRHFLRVITLNQHTIWWSEIREVLTGFSFLEVISNTVITDIDQNISKLKKKKKKKKKKKGRLPNVNFTDIKLLEATAARRSRFCICNPSVHKVSTNISHETLWKLIEFL